MEMDLSVPPLPPPVLEYLLPRVRLYGVKKSLAPAIPCLNIQKAPLLQLSSTSIVQWRAEPIPDPQAFAAMKAALNAGCNLWNAGEFYGSPEANSLQLLNRYFTRYPEDAEKVVLSIKGASIPGQLRIEGTEKNIRRSINECLRVLDGKKFLDIFSPARQDADTPLEETIGTMAQYVKEKKIGGIGISEVTAEQIRKNAALHPIAAVEVELSLQTPDILDNGVAATCAELGIPIVAYSPLGRGLLTAQIAKPEDLDPTDMRHRLPRFHPENMAKNAQLGYEVQKVAKAKGCTPAQVAIAWARSWSQKKGMPMIIPIPGSTTAERAMENGKAVTLNTKELEELEDIRKKTNLPSAIEMYLFTVASGLIGLIPSTTPTGIPIVVSPGLNYTNPTRPPINCTDINPGITPTCYKTLNVTSYLTNWDTKIRRETCSPKQLWSTCFLNFAYLNGTKLQINSTNITKHDCSTLDGNSSTNGCPPPFTKAKIWTPQKYYAVFNIYNVQHHVFVWSQAISYAPSQRGILAALTPNRPNTATSLLQNIILKYGVNTNADNALVRLLESPILRPEPGFAAANISGGRQSLTGAQWVPLLVNRLAEALRLAMKDFDRFLAMVDQGAYSSNNLALAEQLGNIMKGQ
ncbi:MAG: hypothetical protein Q9217_000744 [Psora testacea]